MNKMIYYIQMLTFTKYIYGNSNNKSNVIKIILYGHFASFSLPHYPLMELFHWGFGRVHLFFFLF